ncbi:MAG: hypothetical protein JXR37_01425 [Kiritimatiellae bacterium]|nr:hypothetical protein [Kiritimatiellia bacterium]
MADEESALICAMGDCHGLLADMYRIVEELEDEVGRRADLVLQIGDLGVWPDPARLDRATLKHGESGEFRRWLREGRPVPRVFSEYADGHA